MSRKVILPCGNTNIKQKRIDKQQSNVLTCDIGKTDNLLKQITSMADIFKFIMLDLIVSFK